MLEPLLSKATLQRRVACYVVAYVLVLPAVLWAFSARLDWVVNYYRCEDNGSFLTAQCFYPFIYVLAGTLPLAALYVVLRFRSCKTTIVPMALALGLFLGLYPSRMEHGRDLCNNDFEDAIGWVG